MAGSKRGGEGLSTGKRLRYALEAAPLLGAVGFFRMLPLDTASKVGGWLGRTLLWRALRRPKTIANMRIAFPDLSDAEVEVQLRAMADNMMRVVAETGHLAEFTGEKGRARFRFEGEEHARAAIARGKSILVVSGHFGNFELAFPALRYAGIETAAVTRRPNNPYVADWFEDNRIRLGFDQQFPKGPEGTRQMYRYFRARGNVGMLIDQHLAEGIPVPLFGANAMTVHTPATLALELGVTILPMAVRRDDGARFTVVFHPPILPVDGANSASDIMRMTGEINRFVEAEVRARPAHWVWMHGRWKPTPELSRRAQRILVEASITAETPPPSGDQTTTN